MLTRLTQYTRVHGGVGMVGVIVPRHVVKEVANFIDQRMTVRQSISISVMVSIYGVVRLTFTVKTHTVCARAWRCRDGWAALH